jgi:glyoxylase-like metal-dependent hydrolase (beta-lactamase superfamily II)
MSSTRRHLLASALAGAGLAAQPLKQKKAAVPAPGFHNRITVGSVDVIALSDGGFPLPLGAFPKANADEANQVLRDNFLPPAPMQAYVNCYLIRSGGRNILIDTGCANTFGPTVGFLPGSLRAAGLSPAAIDDIYFTHIHPDHTNGLLDAQGQPLFPRATLHANEADVKFWLDASNTSKVDEGSRPYFAMAEKAFAPYRKRLQSFQPGHEVAPGVFAEDFAGHTPGHTGYMISSGKETLLIWGDIIHAPGLQFTRPDWSPSFDIDATAAIKTRQRVLDMASTDRLQVAGMHLVFPGFGHVARANSGGYRFVPSLFSLKQA